LKFLKINKDFKTRFKNFTVLAANKAARMPRIIRQKLRPHKNISSQLHGVLLAPFRKILTQKIREGERYVNFSRQQGG